MIRPSTAWKYRKLAWKYRGLWKYRGIWRRRKDVLAGAITGVVIGWAATHR